jgi:HK97 gp10 family phage protein
MPDDMTLDLTDSGLEEIIGGLANFEIKLQRKMASAALRVGAKIIQKGVKGNIHSITGAMARAVRVRAGKSGKGYKSIQIVIGSGWFTGDEWYAAFVEFGHKQGKRRGAGPRKQIPGEHPMQYAYQELRDVAVAATIEALADQVLSATRNLGNAR